MRAELGKKYVDRVLDIEGVAMARTEYLNGCVRVCLEYVVDGKPVEYWIDETQIEEKVEEKVAPRGNSGGPRSAPPSVDPR